MKEARPAWSNGGLVMVCRKCSRRVGGRFDLRAWLKDRLKRDARRGAVRVTTSSCLDVCPKGAVTVVIAPSAPNAVPICLVVDPKNDRDALYERIVAATSAG